MTTEVDDFLSKIEVGNEDLDRLHDAVNDPAGTYTDANSNVVPNLRARLDAVGYDVPVAFTSGISVSAPTKTVTHDGVTYAADPSSVPFTTTSTFDETQWVLISNLPGNYASFSDLTDSTRTFAAGVKVAVPSIGAVYEAVEGSGSLGQANAGGQEFDVLLGDVRAWGAVGDGVTDDSPAFSRAISVMSSGDTLTVSKPPVAYIIGDVDVPEGISIVADGYYRDYDLTNLGSEAAKTEALNGNMVLRRKSSAEAIFNYSSNCKVSGLIFDGNGKSAGKFGLGVNTGKITGFQFFSCSWVRWGSGVGTTGTTSYIRNSRFAYCHVHDCDKGVLNLIDSHFLSGEINVCRVGLDLQSGANSNHFTSNRIEWNTEEGVRIDGATSNDFTGGLLDRNGEAGMRIAGASTVQVSNVGFRRNGRNISGSSECAHIHVQGNTSQKILLNNIDTNIGDDDGGGGDVTPDYSLQIQGATKPDTVIVTGGDLSGAVIAPLDIDQEPTNLKIVGVAGVEDWVNSGRLKAKDGQIFTDKVSVPTLAAAATSDTITLTTGVSVGTYSPPQVLTLRVEARNSATGVDYFGYMDVKVQREGGGASFSISPPYRESGTNHVGTTVSDIVQINAGSSSADGDTIDVSVTNNHGSGSVKVNLTVLPM